MAAAKTRLPYADPENRQWTIQQSRQKQNGMASLLNNNPNEITQGSPTGYASDKLQTPANVNDNSYANSRHHSQSTGVDRLEQDRKHAAGL